jgi:hypothetical protein
MNYNNLFRRAAWLCLPAAVVLTTLASCGGGVGSGGTGSPDMGTSIGTVNGFGSVIVDGVAYDDRNASVVVETAPGVKTVTEVKLGHRVSVEYDAAGSAGVICLDTAVVGPASTPVVQGQLSILGQLVTVNGNGTLGPITQFGGGYARATDLLAGDSIEVHGVLVRDASSYRIQATRIDKRASAAPYLRVSGLVSNFAGSSTLTLGALTVHTSSAAVLPAGTSLANGQSITVLAVPDSLTTSGSGALNIQAAQIRVRALKTGGLDDYVSGSVSHLDAQAKTFVLGDVLVNFAAATLSPSGSTLANGLYVQVRGTATGANSLTAGSVTVRDAGSDSEGELKGTLTGYVAATSQFTVRGVLVDASTATLKSCPAGGLSDGLFVEVHGALISNGINATSVECASESGTSTVEREGIARNVDIAGKAFTLVKDGGSTVAVTWTDTTYFGNVKPSTLAGTSVQVEGELVNSVLVASKIKHGD